MGCILQYTQALQYIPADMTKYVSRHYNKAANDSHGFENCNLLRSNVMQLTFQLTDRALGFQCYGDRGARSDR
jgi:hypothetical protein